MLFAVSTLDPADNRQPATKQIAVAGPVISFSTFFGGSNSTAATAVSVDGSGNIYVTGWTASADLPVKNAIQPVFGGSVDAFVAKFDPTGTTLLYSTFLGGSGDDRGFGIAVDGAGSAYITGYTYSTDFPVAGPPTQAKLVGGRDAFVAKLSPAGDRLAYSTFLGGSGNEAGRGIVVDNYGNAFLAGETASPNFPTLHPMQASLKGPQNGFVAWLDTGGSLAFSTYLGGSGTDGATAIAVDRTGSAFVTGFTSSSDFPTLNAFQPSSGGYQDAFVTKYGPYGVALAYSTYLGGSGGTLGNPETGMGIDVDGSGNAYVSGVTSSPNFPVQNAFQSSLKGWLNGFIAKMSATGSSLVYGTYLGGSNVDYAVAIRIDGNGGACAAGYTTSTDFPVVNAVQAVQAGSYDAFLSCLAPTGSILSFSTLLGGGNSDAAYGLARDATSAYLVGQTASGNFPLQGPFQTLNSGQSAFVTKFSQLLPPPPPVLASPANGATGVSVTMVLSWNAASGATSYGVYFGAVSPPPLIVTTAGTAYTPGTLAAGTTYYWQIVASNTGGSANSATWSFMTPVACTYSFSPLSAAPDATGGSGVVAVTAPAGCAWTAVSNAAWLSITAGATGSGTGTVNYAVAVNSTAGVRSAALTIAGQTFTVNQAGVSCTYAIAPASAWVSSGGGSSSVTVLAPAGCSWTTSSNAAWLTILSGASGSGNGTVAYAAVANATVLWQTATLTIGGQTISVTEAPPVATNTEAFVRQLYLDLLNRTADPSGLGTWVNWIDTGVYTRAEVASQFFQSQEFYGTGSYITKLYEGIMLRDPDYGGWLGWYNYLNAGYSQTDILNQFLLSPEFQSRYGNLDNTAFVTLAYNNILNRAPDPASLAQWVAWLNNGTYTRAQVMYQFITSPEFNTRILNRLYANMLYIGFLRRAGDPNGLNGWANWLAAGTYTLDQEVNGFITSPEYLARF